MGCGGARPSTGRTMVNWSCTRMLFIIDRRREQNTMTVIQARVELYIQYDHDWMLPLARHLGERDASSLHLWIDFLRAIAIPIMLIGVGIDILSLSRLQGLIQRRTPQALAKRICSPKELIKFRSLVDSGSNEVGKPNDQILRFLSTRYVHLVCRE